MMQLAPPAPLCQHRLRRCQGVRPGGDSSRAFSQLQGHSPNEHEQRAAGGFAGRRRSSCWDGDSQQSQSRRLRRWSGTRGYEWSFSPIHGLGSSRHVELAAPSSRGGRLGASPLPPRGLPGLRKAEREETEL